MFHDRIKHVKVDYYYIREMMMSQKVITPYIKFEDQFNDVFTDTLGRNIFCNICPQSGLSSIYASV